jgi:hypothetical protein
MKQSATYNTSILMIDDDHDDCLFMSQALAAITDEMILICTENIHNTMAFS